MSGVAPADWRWSTHGEEWWMLWRMMDDDLHGGAHGLIWSQMWFWCPVLGSSRAEVCPHGVMMKGCWWLVRGFFSTTQTRWCDARWFHDDGRQQTRACDVLRGEVFNKRWPRGILVKMMMAMIQRNGNGMVMEWIGVVMDWWWMPLVAWSLETWCDHTDDCCLPYCLNVK